MAKQTQEERAENLHFGPSGLVTVLTTDHSVAKITNKKALGLTGGAGRATSLPGASLDSLSHWRRGRHHSGCRLIHRAL